MISIVPADYMATNRPTAFGQNLRRIRKAQGLSQEDLATRLGVQREQVSHLERGKTKSPGAETIGKVAAALGVSVAELLAEDLAAADGAALLQAFRESAYFAAIQPTPEEMDWLARNAKDFGGLGIKPTPEAFVALLKARRGTL